MGGITPGDPGTHMESVDGARIFKQGIWKVLKSINPPFVEVL